MASIPSTSTPCPSRRRSWRVPIIIVYGYFSRALVGSNSNISSGSGGGGGGSGSGSSVTSSSVGGVCSNDRNISQIILISLLMCILSCEFNVDPACHVDLQDAFCAHVSLSCRNAQLCCSSFPVHPACMPSAASWPRLLMWTAGFVADQSAACAPRRCVRVEKPL